MRSSYTLRAGDILHVAAAEIDCVKVVRGRVAGIAFKSGSSAELAWLEAGGTIKRGEVSLFVQRVQYGRVQLRIEAPAGWRITIARRERHRRSASNSHHADCFTAGKAHAGNVGVRTN